MVDITAVEQNQEKRMKRNEDSLRDHQMHQHSHYRGPKRRREKESA